MSKNKKVNNVSANVSNLGKKVMFAESIGDFARQFAGDVDRNGKEFSKLMSRFNPKNMYDVCVLGQDRGTHPSSAPGTVRPSEGGDLQACHRHKVL